MMASPVQVFESTWIAKAVVMFFLRPTAYVELATQYDAGYVLTHSAGPSAPRVERPDGRVAIVPSRP